MKISIMYKSKGKTFKSSNEETGIPLHEYY